MKTLPQKLRQWRKDHPKTDFALGFVPYVGAALAADDFTQDPSILGAAGLALGPLSHAAKALRRAPSLGIKAYHGTRTPWKDLKVDAAAPKRLGSVEGEGFYQTLDPDHAAAWASSAAIPTNRLGGGWDDMKYMKRRGQNAMKRPGTVVYETDIPDEEFAKYLNLSNREAVLEAVEKAGYSKKEAAEYYATWADRHAKRLREFPNAGPDKYEDLLPFKLGTDEWGDTVTKINANLRERGVPGVYRPKVDRVLTFDKDAINVIGRHK